MPGALTDQQRRVLVASGWPAGRHVLPGATLILAGVRGGLLLRRVLTALGADSPEGRRARLASVLTRPWAVLSAGVPFAEFTEVLKIAFDEGGASGFIAGRSVWREVLPLSGAERQRFLETVARPRLDALVDVAAGRARPWHEARR